MKNLLNAKWLIVINTLPVTILFLIFYGEYNVIKTLLEDDNITLWYYFGFTLFFLSIINLGYTITLIVLKKEISLFYAFAALIIYTIYLYTYSSYSSDIIPFNIPRWMISNDLILYAGTFLMPTLAHALFVIVIKLTTKDKKHKAWVNFLISISIPLLTYLFAQIILPLWRFGYSGFEEHIIIISIIVTVILFLFFLIRGIYILSIKKSEFWKKNQLLWKIPVSILFPLLGLAVNQGFLLNSFEANNSGILGDFSNPWFYILAFLNGLLICLPNAKNKLLRILLFFCRATTFSFTFYFFIVFLPFLPLSVIAILALGLGFLMLSPLVLFIIHIQELSNDYHFLKNHYKKNTLATLSVLSFLIIPICITISFSIDKQVLNNTLDYIYSPDYSKEYNIDKVSLEKTLNNIKSNKEGNRDFIFGSQTPYISRYFKWLVLDNLTLSDTKINSIEKIFFNAKPFELRPDRLRNKHVEISNISTSSTFNTKDNSWTSWIDLEITNNNESNFTSEYATTINLPDGCWINDYYLYVGDKKEMGILAEKKSAMWVFSQIRNTNRDPGLLHYLTGNKVSFRIFPFTKNEIRKTGIQFIHKEPVNIVIDGNNLALGEERTLSNINISKNDNVVYISTKEKEQLQKTQRTPYYHFIVDISKNKDSLKTVYKNTINNFITNNSLKTNKAKISYTNSYSKTTEFNNDWNFTLDNQNFEGGFYLERSIKKALVNVQSNNSNYYPIIIVVTDNMQNAIIHKDFADFKLAYPESNLFYHLNTMGHLASHNLNFKPKNHIKKNTVINTNNSVLVWPNKENLQAYLADNKEPSIILKSLSFNINENDIYTGHWNSGLLMQGKWLSSIYHPENSEADWYKNVKMSFQSKIMTPLTSYIVVENEAQKAILKKKQEQVLSGKKSLDLNEDTQRMSEPEFIILIILIGIFFFIKRKSII